MWKRRKPYFGSIPRVTITHHPTEGVCSHIPTGSGVEKARFLTSRNSIKECAECGRVITVGEEYARQEAGIEEVICIISTTCIDCAEPFGFGEK